MHDPNEAISKSGSVTTDETLLFKPMPQHGATIRNITFTNSNDATAWELWVYRRLENGGTLFLLYHFILDAGDRVEDNTMRYLMDQHEIVAKASVDSIQYSIEGTQTPAT